MSFFRKEGDGSGESGRVWLLDEIRRRWGSVRAHHGERYPEHYPRELEQRFHCRSGQRLLMRPIRPEDVDLMKECFARFSPATIYRRFHGYIKNLPEKTYYYLTHVDYLHHLALVALDEKEGRIVGVARFYRPEAAELAEAAVVVADEWQGRGVGKFLFQQLIGAAEKVGIAGFEAFVQSDNLPMRRMIETSGYRVHVEPQGDILRIWLIFAEKDGSIHDLC